MKYDPNAPYLEWVEKVRAAELEFARKQISKGQDINLVMEAMAERISKKLLHPLIAALHSEKRS